VLGGIHAAKLRDAHGQFDIALAETEAREAGLSPLATLPYFIW
jgi:hypothetical protein